jgi:hypothetical protein
MRWASFRKIWEDEKNEIFVLSVPPEYPTITLLKEKSSSSSTLYINGNHIPTTENFSIYIKEENENKTYIVLELVSKVDNITLEKEILTYEWKSWIDSKDVRIEKFKHHSTEIKCICHCHYDNTTNEYLNPEGCENCSKNH